MPYSINFLDMIFTENTNVIFKVALALLSYHRDNLLKCENFEEIMSYLKTTMTAINTHSLDQIMKHVRSYYYFRNLFLIA